HGKRTMMLIGSLVTALAALPILWAINTGTFLGAVLAMIIAFPVAHSVVYATSSGFISGLFDPQVRYTGASISYQLGGLISPRPVLLGPHLRPLRASGAPARLLDLLPGRRPHFVVLGTDDLRPALHDLPVVGARRALSRRG